MGPCASKSEVKRMKELNEETTTQNKEIKDHVKKQADKMVELQEQVAVNKKDADEKFDKQGKQLTEQGEAIKEIARDTNRNFGDAMKVLLDQSKKQTEVLEQVKNQGETIKHNRSQIDETKTHLEATAGELQGSISTAEHRLGNRLTEEVDAIRTDMSDRKRQVEAQMDRQDTILREEIEGASNRLELRFTEHAASNESEMKQLEIKVELHNTELEQQVQQVDGRVDSAEAQLDKDRAVALETTATLQRNAAEDLSRVEERLDQEASERKLALQQQSQKAEGLSEALSARISYGERETNEALEKQRRENQVVQQELGQNIKDSEQRAKEHSDKELATAQADASHKFAAVRERMGQAEAVSKLHENRLTTMNADMEYFKTTSEAQRQGFELHIKEVDERGTQYTDAAKRELQQHMADAQQNIDGRLDGLQSDVEQDRTERIYLAQESRTAREGLSETIGAVRQDLTTEQEKREAETVALLGELEETKKSFNEELKAMDVRRQEELRQEEERRTQTEETMNSQVTQLRTETRQETHGVREHMEEEVATLRREQAEQANASEMNTSQQTESVRKEMRELVDNTNTRLERAAEKFEAADSSAKAEFENIHGTLQDQRKQIESTEAEARSREEAIQENLNVSVAHLQQQVAGDFSTVRSQLQDQSDRTAKREDNLSRRIDETKTEGQETREHLEKETEEIRKTLERRATEVDNSLRQHVQTRVHDSEARTATGMETLQAQIGETTKTLENQKTELERVDSERKSQGQEIEERLDNQQSQQAVLRRETDARIAASQEQVMQRVTETDEQLAKGLDMLKTTTDKQATQTANLTHKLDNDVKTFHEALAKRDEEQERQLEDVESRMKERLEMERVERRDAIAQQEQNRDEKLSRVEDKIRKQEADTNIAVNEISREVGNQREQFVEISDEQSKRLQALEEDNEARARQDEVDEHDRQKTELEINQHFEVHEQRLKEMEENGAERGARLEEGIRNNQRAIQEERRQREGQEQQLGATLDNVRTHMSEVEEQRQAEFRQLEATLTDNLAEETRERGQAMTIQRQEAEEIKVGLEETKEDLEALEGKVKRNKTELQRTKDRLLTTSESYGQEIRELRERQTNAEEQNEVFKRETLTTVDEMNSHFQRLEDEDRRLDRESRQRESNLRGTLEQEQQQALDVVRQEREQLQTDFTSHIDTVRDEVDRNIDRVRGQVAQQGEKIASVEKKSRKDISDVKRRMQQIRSDLEDARFDEIREQTQQTRSSVALLQRVMKQQIGDGSELVPMQDQDTGYDSPQSSEDNQPGPRN